MRQVYNSQFKLWSDDVVRGLGLRESREIVGLAGQATLELSDYLMDIIQERRLTPQDDLITDLIAAEEEGGKLTEGEILSTCILLLVAGHETTVNLIGNGMLALLRHTDQLDLLRGEPGLVHGAIDKFLRYDSPVPVAFRLAFEDMAMGDKIIRKGDGVGILLAAANRDPEQFPDPDRLDISHRENRHIAVGHGIHFCLGAALARLEGAIAVNNLLRRITHLGTAS